MVQRYCSIIIIYRNDLETVRFLIPLTGITHSYRLDQSIREICVSHPNFPSFRDNKRVIRIEDIKFVVYNIVTTRRIVICGTNNVINIR